MLPAALPGIITGIVLALARIAGETAPLLFTAFNNRFFTTSLTQPISSLTVQVFTYAISPYEDWHRQAWAGALVLVTIVLLCSLLARFATRAPREHSVDVGRLRRPPVALTSPRPYFSAPSEIAAPPFAPDIRSGRSPGRSRACVLFSCACVSSTMELRPRS